MSIAERTNPVMSPAQIIKAYPAHVQTRTDAWLSQIQTELKKWWTNATRDSVVIEMPPYMDPELRLEIIMKLQERGWTAREGNNGQYLILCFEEGES